MEDVPAGVEGLRTVEQAEPCLHGSDLIVFERGREPSHGARRRDRIGIEEDDDLRPNGVDAHVAAAAEAEVPPGTDDAHFLAIDLQRAGVVDDDDLVRLADERVETSIEVSAAVVSDNDDCDGQYAPLRAITAGSVFARIEMSSQIDQFSR
jgi:hypothetical protein